MPQTQAITHTMEPALPGKLTVATVGGGDDSTRFYAISLGETPAPSGPDPDDGARLPDGLWREVPIVARRGEVFTLDMPSGDHAVYGLSLVPHPGAAAVRWINRPRLDWNYPARPTPGGSLRIIGRQLIRPDDYAQADRDLPRSGARLVDACAARVVLEAVDADRPAVDVAIESASAYELHLRLPPDLTPGQYHVRAHNGLGGAWGWSKPLAIEVVEADTWPERVFLVDEFGDVEGLCDAPVAAAIDAARQAGGGVVRFGRRRYLVRQPIVVPPRVTLRGEGPDVSEITTPMHGGADPPFVLITGDRDFAVEDLRLTGHSSTTALVCAPTFLPETFEEAMRAGDTERRMGWSDIRAERVYVRRCRLVQKMNYQYWRRPADHEHLHRLHKWMDTGHLRGFAAIRLRGDHLEVTDSEVFGGGAAIMLHACTHVRVAGCAVRAGASGVGVHAQSKLIWPEDAPAGERGATIRGNYSRYLLVEENHVVPWSERGRGAIFFWFGGEDCHAARNHVADLWRCYDAEAVGTHLWMARWPTPKLRMIEPTVGQIVDPQGEVAEEILDGAAVEIVEGRGIGQLRRIERREGNRVWLDRPWDFEPDETSLTVFTAPPPFERVQFVDNEIRNVGSNITLWGCNRDVVCDGNVCADGAGLQVWSVRLAPDQKVWGGAAFVSVINNVYETGWAQPTRDDPLGSTYGHGVISTPSGHPGDAPRHGWDYLGLIVRNNLTRGNSGIVVKTRWAPRKADAGAEAYESDVSGIVVEDNHAIDSHFGLLLEEGVGIIERHNSTERVRRPVWWARSAGT